MKPFCCCWCDALVNVRNTFNPLQNSVHCSKGCEDAEIMFRLWMSDEEIHRRTHYKELTQGWEWCYVFIYQEQSTTISFWEAPTKCCPAESIVNAGHANLLSIESSTGITNTAVCAVSMKGETDERLTIRRVCTMHKAGLERQRFSSREVLWGRAWHKDYLLL